MTNKRANKDDKDVFLTKNEIAGTKQDFKRRETKVKINREMKRLSEKFDLNDLIKND